MKINRMTPSEAWGRGLTVITAHSGCEGTPANSREHLRAAAESGAEMLEVDVRMDGNGRLYLSHDLPADPSVCVDFSALLDTLRDAPEMRVNCDVKTGGLIVPVMQTAAAAGLSDRILFTGECNDVPDEIARMGGELWYSMWPRDNTPEKIRAAALLCPSVGSPCINLHYSMITDENFAMMRRLGLSFSAWTADDEDTIRRLLRMGIMNITTRKPRLALALRKELQGA